MLKSITFDDPSPPCTTDDFKAFVEEFRMPPGRVFREFCEMCRGGSFVLRDVSFLPSTSHAAYYKDFSVTEEKILINRLWSIHRGTSHYSTFCKTTYLRERQSLFPKDTRLFAIGNDPIGNSFIANIFYNDPILFLWERETGESYSISESLEAFYNGLRG